MMHEMEDGIVLCGLLLRVLLMEGLNGGQVDMEGEIVSQFCCT